jgi:eukaryotic-like serine/threonine-protein kinase
VTASSIAHYNLLEKIGEGGLGEVFRARDTRAGRTIALKVFPTQTADGVCPDALLADARASASISHPNIATLFDVGHADGACYLAYEFVTGSPLSASMFGGPMNPLRAIELCIQIADALADLEASGIAHGDLRPDTVAVTAKGAAKLLDTGMWQWTRGGHHRRAAASDPSTLLPEAASVVPYLSPEQAVGPDWDSRSDMFSLATMLYEMVTGRNPFAAATPQDIVVNVIRLKAPPASTIAPDVPPEVDRVLAKAMAKNLEHRYDSAALFAAALRAAAAHLAADAPAAKTVDYMLPVDDRADRVPAMVWVAVAVGVALLMAIAYWAMA